MKKFWKTIGIVAASGLIFGTLAGGSFVGVKKGTEVVENVISETFGKNDSKDSNETAKDSDSGKSGNLLSKGSDDEDSSEEDSVTIGSTNTVNISTEGSTDDGVADLAEQVMPSIVSITSTTYYQNPYAYFYGGSSSYPVTGAGSGIIIGEDDDRYLIATNNHVVEDCEELTIGFCDGTDVSAEIVGTDSSNDLAVVSVNKSDLSSDTLDAIKVAEIGDSDSVRVGESCMAIGNALGYGQSVTVGYISALNRTVTVNNVKINMLQTDAAINEGNSGGALFNMNGEVIGINSAKAQNSDNNVEGMCFAIPMSDALPIIEDIINGTNNQASSGTAYMGIQGKDISSYDAASFKMPQGVYIVSAVEDGPAYEAGIQSGDIITAIDGQSVTSMTDIKSIIAQKSPEDQITVTVSRSDQGGNYTEQNITVTLGKAAN